jgi:predicted transcriptional regulator
MGKKKSEKLDPIEEIKRLLVLGLISQGVKGKDIASVLEVDPAVISRMISGKKT